ncbi:metal ABC transporter substrate-binding protein [Phycicoccus sp. SLBN-51]|uniref:metal ABC transporter substrate-binding protein n=1 Tax=Phycicoccus sp. SLBN-51 TaxID=2768447 RepID=UPI0011677A18|nr:metal ABC transporter substrate-binding protein [Phycicoccus sp. SLBN-51]TQJ51266.1 zinc transport system substrate-binding protein [Phycicoccus sp. SLBN-51]
MLRRRLLATTAALGLVGLGASACSGAAAIGGDQGNRVEVAAGFYALEYATSRIGGDRVDVTALTKPGVEPHDVELSARKVASVALADVVVYERGFQSAVDEAVDHQARGRVLDVSHAARLVPGPEHDHAGEAAGSHGEDHSTDANSGQQTAHAGEAPDPHFWLDPQRYADVARAIGAALEKADPAHAGEYRQRTTAFTGELAALDREFAAGLKTCRNRDLVTGHAAFGYLAARYDFHQQGITGLSPEAEPSPAALARIAHFVKDGGVRTIYAETLVSPAVAETLARETGAAVKVLDPLEGLTDESAGHNYFDVMRANLATLRAGQECT